MPCNCSGVRMKRCSCKVFGYPTAKSRTQNVVLVEEDSLADDTRDKLNFFLRVFENVYDKCAEYNLRYCPLRGKHKRGRPLANAAKDMTILIWFLIANFVIFLNIFTRITIHMFLVFGGAFRWLERTAQGVFNRHLMKSECDQTIKFNPRLNPD